MPVILTIQITVFSLIVCFYLKVIPTSRNKKPYNVSCIWELLIKNNHALNISFIYDRLVPGSWSLTNHVLVLFDLRL